ncbi:flagellar protein FliT [Lachnospira sp.]|jgi:hypothetical protein|uniref:flagellar protein FliT n=1 Tax=Lachnospira sp. TaxID=2049031 RepID=UPI00257B457E|nr:flagellar protein FliT [Lachnospira sp.]
MENYLEIMKDSLKKKIKVLEKIEELDRVQTELFSADPFDEEKTRASFEEKGKYINELDRLDAGFQSLFNKMKDQLDGKKDQYKEEIKEMQSLIRRVTELSVTIESQEKRNKDLATKRFNGMRKEISNAKRSTSLAKQYYSAMNNVLNVDPQFMDSKS